MNTNSTPTCDRRVIGFDCYPDTFTAAMIEGKTPAQAIVQKIYNRMAMSQLQSWAKKNTNPEDLIVLEASGNSFQVVRSLIAVERKAIVLESCQMGKLKEAHANNDKISAVRVGKAYLAGTAKSVWVPDLKTQERRDWFHAHRKSVKRTTQMQNRILSYLSDNGVRLEKGEALDEVKILAGTTRQAGPWSARQSQVLKGHFMERAHAQQQREHWQSLMAQEVLEDPLLLSLVRLCGVREIVAFSLGAIIGDVHRFASPAKLVKYLGLNPAFDDSGEGERRGGIGGHGRNDLRALLVESAQSIMRSPTQAQGKWGRQLLARKGSVNLAVAAVARKLAVAIWYLMMGKWTDLEEVDVRLDQKIGKIVAHVGPQGLKVLDKTSRQLKEQARETIKTGRTYVLNPVRMMALNPAPVASHCRLCGSAKAVPRPKSADKTSSSTTRSKAKPALTQDCRTDPEKKPLIKGKKKTEKSSC